MGGGGGGGRGGEGGSEPDKWFFTPSHPFMYIYIIIRFGVGGTVKLHERKKTSQPRHDGHSACNIEFGFVKGPRGRGGERKRGRGG